MPGVSKDKLVNFLQRDVWRIRAAKLPPRKSFFLRQVRIVLLSLRGFSKDKCNLRASALTFYSLLSIVPVMAVLFGVAKGFGLEKLLEKQLIEKMPGQQEVVGNIIAFSHTLLENTKGGLVAGIGVALLFWTVIKVLGDIEESFNDIWGVKKLRSFGRRFSDYLSMMFICPVLLILSSGLTVFINTQTTMIVQRFAVLGAFSHIFYFLLTLLPYTTMWAVFTFIYIFMPNTKVNFRSGLIAGIVAGTVYQAVQWFYIKFQVGVANYNAIYGSFAAVPLFLVWMQLSWRIVLFGAEISFASQNVDTYEFEQESSMVSPAFKKLITLAVAHLIVKNFKDGKGALSAQQISHMLEMPIRLVRQVVYDLSEVKILTATQAADDRSQGYLPGRDIGNLKIKDIVDAFEHEGYEDIPVAQTPELETLRRSLEEFSERIRTSPANLNLKDV